ncbi:MAG: LemA family protein [Pseudomonadota bacterium]
METIIAVALVAGGYIWYAVIISRRNRVDEALAGIDVQLTKRHDLIPNVLAVARKFMEHEKGLLSDITELRTRASTNVVGASPQDVSAKFEAADALGAKLQQLFISVEDYPELKSDTTMQTAGI